MVDQELDPTLSEFKICKPDDVTESLEMCGRRELMVVQDGSGKLRNSFKRKRVLVTKPD